MARPCPISRGRRTVPPSIKGTPHRRQNTPNVEDVAATRRSHQMASSNPPATACPSTAATTGLARRVRVGPIGPGPAGSYSKPETWVRSNPAQNVPPAPVRTATVALAQDSNSSKADLSNRAVSGSTAFLCCGRLISTVQTAPFLKTRTLGPQAAAGAQDSARAAIRSGNTVVAPTLAQMFRALRMLCCGLVCNVPACRLWDFWDP
jgi:hypothetical protein